MSLLQILHAFRCPSLERFNALLNDRVSVYRDQTILSYLMKGSVFIGGGRALEYFDCKFESSDLDVWVQDYEQKAKEVENSLKKIGVKFVIHETENAYTFRIPVPSFVLQIIKRDFENPEDVLSCFDMSCCSIGVMVGIEDETDSDYLVSGISQEWFFGKGFLESIETKTLGLRKETKINRILKYANKGFHLSDRDVTFVPNMETCRAMILEERAKALEDYDGLGQKLESLQLEPLENENVA